VEDAIDEVRATFLSTSWSIDASYLLPNVGQDYLVLKGVHLDTVSHTFSITLFQDMYKASFENRQDRTSIIYDTLLKLGVQLGNTVGPAACTHARVTPYDIARILMRDLAESSGPPQNIFCSSNLIIGLGPRALGPGDLLVGLPGCAQPFALRSREPRSFRAQPGATTSGSWLLDLCYVHQVEERMDIQTLFASNKPTEIFEIW
jgi:hypothetical protein